jgi:TMEM175 potassium channel family protein
VTQTPSTSTAEGLATGRIMALADGVFAIVLTLLVLDLHAPTATTNAQLARQLREIVPSLRAFVVSFAVVGIFWYGHHMESHWIRRSDRIHIGITLLLLLAICLIPFSAALLGKNQGIPLAASIYGANLWAAGVVRYAHWAYATRGSRLVDPGIDPEFVRHVRRVFLLVIVLYLAAIAIAWLSTIIATACFVAIPILYVIPARQTQHLTSLRPAL